MYFVQNGTLGGLGGPSTSPPEYIEGYKEGPHPKISGTGAYQGGGHLQSPYLEYIYYLGIQKGATPKNIRYKGVFRRGQHYPAPQST